MRVERVASDKIRNVALVGHVGAGKTTVAEALLFRAGVLNRQGRIEEGNTVCDFDPEEKSHGMSVSLALAPFIWKGHKINVIDTPGYVDFIGEVRAALRVADLAVFVISAPDGVEVQTEAIWEEVAHLGIPRMFFINKLDSERADFNRTLDELKDRFGAGVAPLELPLGEGEAFHGIADLLTDTAYVYDSGEAKQVEVPEDIEALEHQVHDDLVEGIVVADDEMLERYLEGDVPPFGELEKTLARGVADATVFPVVCGSATVPIGVDRLADFIAEIGTSPQDRPPVEVNAGDTTAEIAPDPNEKPLAFVFKTIADEYVGQISLCKALSGTIHPNEHLVNTRSNTEENLHGLISLRGSEQETLPEATAGDLFAVAKLTDTHTGDTLAPKGTPVSAARVEWPTPVLASAISGRTQSDEDKLATALYKLRDEDPVISVERNDETKQTLLRATGPTHLTVTLERLGRKYGVEIDTEDEKVAYRETITGKSEAEGKYKKQSGGHGQFGVAFLRVEPLARGEGFEFVDEIVGGAIPRQFIPAVEKGVVETMADGGVFGFPVVDVRVICYDGKHHSVDSSEMSFKQAGRIGFKTAIEQAKPVILEPISEINIMVPNESQGDVMGDLNGRRGRVQGTIPVGDDRQMITATVPTSEILRYIIDLRSLTGGRGTYSQRHIGYDQLPDHLYSKVRTSAADEQG